MVLPPWSIVMSKRQVTLFSTWQTSQSKQAIIEPEETNRSSEFEDKGDDNITVSPEVIAREQSSQSEVGASSCPEQSSQQCIAQCCSTDEEAFQPIDKPTLSGLSFNQRNFQSKWYKDYPWLSVCTIYKKVLNVPCIIIIIMLVFFFI